MQATGGPGAPARATGVQVDGRPPGLHLGAGYLGSRGAGDSRGTAGWGGAPGLETQGILLGGKTDGNIVIHGVFFPSGWENGCE